METYGQDATGSPSTPKGLTLTVVWPSRIVMAFKVFRCWPSEYVALADLDSGANAVAIESITLQNEGWERDTSVTEPAEPA